MASRADLLQVLRLVRECLEAWGAGNASAFATLGEQLGALHVDPETIAAAAAVLNAQLDGDGPIDGGLTESGGATAHRVASEEERLAFGPAAWGFLLELRRRGDLDAAQFERVVDELTHAGVRPVPVEMAQLVATRVAMAFEVADEEGANGEVELPN